MTTPHSIVPMASTEYGSLKKVIMCMANPFDLDIANLPAELLDEASLYQAEHSDMRPYDMAKVHAQQNELIRVLKSNGAEVIQIEPLGSGVLQHYTRDVGFVVHDQFFIDRPRRDYRKKELKNLGPITRHLKNVHRIETGCIEGGDVLVDGDTVIIGQGEETDIAGINAVINVLQEKLPNISVKTLSFTHRGVIHTDTIFNIVGPGLAILHRPSLIPEDISWLENRYELIDATEDEARMLAINTLAIGDNKVVMLAPGGRLADKLTDHGLTPILIDYSEVTALPGSFRCTTLPVVRS